MRKAASELQLDVDIGGYGEEKRSESDHGSWTQHGTDGPREGPTLCDLLQGHALALSDAGHEVQVFLTGEATSLMPKSTVEAVKPIGWPPLTELRDKAVATGLRVFS